MANSLYEYDYYGDEAGEAEGESVLARLVRLLGGAGAPAGARTRTATATTATTTTTSQTASPASETTQGAERWLLGSSLHR